MWLNKHNAIETKQKVFCNYRNQTKQLSLVKWRFSLRTTSVNLPLYRPLVSNLLRIPFIPPNYPYCQIITSFWHNGETLSLAIYTNGSGIQSFSGPPANMELHSRYLPDLTQVSAASIMLCLPLGLFLHIPTFTPQSASSSVTNVDKNTSNTWRCNWKNLHTLRNNIWPQEFIFAILEFYQI